MGASNGSMNSLNASDKANIIMAIASILNIALVLIFYFKDKSSRKQDETMQKKSYWFRNIIFDKNLSNIEEFYSNNKTIIKVLKSLQTNDAIIKSIQDNIYCFQEGKRQLIYCFNDSIRIFDVSLANILDNSLDYLEDIFTNKTYNILIGKSADTFDSLEKEIMDHKRGFLKTIYDFEMNGYMLHDKKRGFFKYIARNKMK